MSISFNSETFRDDFTYYNSPEAIARFPFPFDEDQYMYKVNMEQHTPGEKGSVLERALDVDEHYIAEMQDRAKVLAEDPNRSQTLPHMETAAWDTVELIMTLLARDYPELFSLERDGETWHWINRPLGLDHTFRFGDSTTLPPRPGNRGDEPMPPLEYITRQVQGDFAVLDQRDDNLWMDAGTVTSQADWSLDFDIGMDFYEWHGPVPLAHEMGIFERALKYLLSIEQHNPGRRLNWTMTINPRLDTSPENYNTWGSDRTEVTPDNVGEKVHLRVEVQTFFRLPRSNALLFPIRTYLISLNDLVTVPQWGQRLHRVLRDLPPELVEYKGLTTYLDTVVDWLAPYDQASKTTSASNPYARSSNGTHP